LKRLVKEWRYFESKNAAEEILSFSVVDRNNLKRFEAKIKGPLDTPYENGVFVLDVWVSESYPFKPPRLMFKTKVFHPNIDAQGRICLDILCDMWTPLLTFEKILLSISGLLSLPYTDEFFIPEAAFLYENDRMEYNRKAREWTRKYAMPVDDLVEISSNLNEASSLNYCRFET
jgi:ubiquitin-conjugating enzyme E2 D/E